MIIEKTSGIDILYPLEAFPVGIFFLFFRHLLFIFLIKCNAYTVLLL